MNGVPDEEHPNNHLAASEMEAATQQRRATFIVKSMASSLITVYVCK